MMGTVDPQRTFADASFWCGGVVPEDSIYVILNRHGDALFRDEDFASMYCPDNGRESIPPTLLARTLLLQLHDKVSDRETVLRVIFDLRYKTALNVPLDYAGFDASTLCIFRARLLVNNVEPSPRPLPHLRRGEGVYGEAGF